MEALFTRDYYLVWALALAALLFFPVRHLLWVLYVRRASRTGTIDSLEQQRLKRRAAITSALLCFVFSVLYTGHLFEATP